MKVFLGDLLNHLPTRYVDYSKISKISDLKINEVVTIKGKIVSLKNLFTKRGLRMQIGSVQDETSKLSVVWFNQPFLVKSFYPGREVSLSGKVTLFSGRLAMVSPEYELLTNLHETVHTGKLVPIYPETSDISSKWIRTKIRKTFDVGLSQVKEFLPDKVRKKYNLVEIRKAYKLVHFPKSLAEAEKGRVRLAFNELLFLQLQNQYRKIRWQRKRSAKKLVINKLTINKFIGKLPFKLTESQKTAINEILSDMSKNIPMNRLLEGDVGSGKTVVAAIAAYSVFENGYQSIFMAPTQILAQQHYKTLKKLFPKLKISLVIASSQKPIVDSDIFVGTHALLHKKLDFGKVALVVIDEQHRFGVEQRANLIKKSHTPHVLTMTATPIPRTIVQTVYGDLDLSILSDMPLGRQKIITWHVSPQKRSGAYEWIKSQISNLKSQVFIVCPLIEESEKESMRDIKNVTTEFHILQSTFKNLKLGLLHGRLKSKEKDKVLNDFRSRKIDILVTTQVVEVGIDIPNATIMVIEAAERFGLSQLHQLRGRVGRSDKKSYCLLFSNIKYSKRLNAMTKTNSGLELAELDLKLRGPGEIFGTKQHGFPEFKAASWSDTDLIKKTKSLAEEILKFPGKYQEFNVKSGV